MNKSAIRNVLEALMQRHRIETDAELARRVPEISSPTIHRLIAGTTPDPHISTVLALARYFNVTLGQMVGEEPLEEEPVQEKKSIFKIPLLSWEEVSLWKKQALPSSELNDWIEVNCTRNPKAFALQLKSHTVSNPFKYKAILIIDPDKSPQDNDFIIVQEKSKKSAILRYAICDGDNFLLKAPNDIVDTILMDDNFDVYGVVQQVNLIFI